MSDNKVVKHGSSLQSTRGSAHRPSLPQHAQADPKQALAKVFKELAVARRALGYREAQAVRQEFIGVREALVRVYRALNAHQLRASPQAIPQAVHQQQVPHQFATQQVVAQRVAAQQVAAQQVAAQKLAVQVAAQQVAAQKVAVQVAAQRVAAQRVAAQQVAAQQVINQPRAPVQRNQYCAPGYGNGSYANQNPSQFGVIYYPVVSNCLVSYQDQRVLTSAPPSRPTLGSRLNRQGPSAPAAAPAYFRSE
ncbi:hypothetical protein NKR23_g2714 [Pleurostoma richardsiae]|uniref:Uncharacterized protein n=1 Tax=Pleurostoma richardsiae TaxID=41990 RepID=A0AA38S6X3_9PEZI|nr:hypothetical protein NKR23_g2714 [Pleurostoma richardsiae]